MHANTFCAPTDRQNGDVVLKLKSPYKDGTTHIVMTPLEFLQKLAALVPRPRFNLIRYFGVLAPNAKLRPLVLPHPPDSNSGIGAEQDESVQNRRQHISWPLSHIRVLRGTWTSLSNGRVYSSVARMKCNEIRGNAAREIRYARLNTRTITASFPDFISFHPGYPCLLPRGMTDPVALETV